MTDTGYKMVIDRIVNRQVVPPTDLSIRELSVWLNAYAQCQNDILDVIETLRKGQRD